MEDKKQGKIEKKFELIEGNVLDAPVRDVKWEGHELQVQSDPILDGGTGKPVIMRTYEFRFPPGLKGRPTKEQILTPAYKKYLDLVLWTDGLEMVQEPKVVIKKRGFYIFATCQAKRGEYIPSQLIPLPLQTAIETKKHGS